MLPRGARVTWERPGMVRGTGIVEQGQPAHNDRLLYQVRDERGNVFWFPHDDLTEVAS